MTIKEFVQQQRASLLIDLMTQQPGCSPATIHGPVADVYNRDRILMRATVKVPDGRTWANVITWSAGDMARICRMTHRDLLERLVVLYPSFTTDVVEVPTNKEAGRELLRAAYEGVTEVQR